MDTETGTTTATVEETASMRDGQTDGATSAGSEGGATQEDFSDIGGSKKSELVNWYLESISDEIETVADLELWKMKIEKIISRLIDHEHAVIAIVPTEVTPGDGTVDAGEDPFLVVHPNFVVEE